MIPPINNSGNISSGNTNNINPKNEAPEENQNNNDETDLTQIKKELDNASIPIKTARPQTITRSQIKVSDKPLFSREEAEKLLAPIREKIKKGNQSFTTNNGELEIVKTNKKAPKTNTNFRLSFLRRNC